MWIIRISLELYGNNFSPKALLNEVKDNIHVFYSNEPTDINDKDPDGIFGFGNLIILCPQIYGLQYEMTDYENWYLNFIDNNIMLLNKNGITEMSLYIEVFDNGGQLNFEIFSREMLKKIGQYDIAIPVSYYRLTIEQIIKMLDETEISKEKLKKYVLLG
jgi:hypothetical protein